MMLKWLKITNQEPELMTIYKQKILNYINYHELYQTTRLYNKWERKRGLKENAILREICPDEIVIEFDSDTQERGRRLAKKTITKLLANSYNFFVFDHGGRSPHIHVYGIYGLEKEHPEVIRQYKKEFLKKYAPYPETDHSLTGIHLVAVEFKPHFKHKTIKQLQFGAVFDNTIYNNIELELLQKAKEVVNKNKNYVIYPTNTNADWLLDFVMEFDEYKHMMDLWVFKNLAIFMVNKNIQPEPIVEELTNKLGRKVRYQLKGWLKWARREPRHLNLKEVKRFCELHNIDYRGVKNRFGKNNK